jgi:para-nitrobenzyl esterase
MNTTFKILIILFCSNAAAYGQATTNPTGAAKVKISNGLLEGTTDSSGIKSFKGIPFAQPPVGDLRWKEPQPAANWNGIRKADQFGNNGMQKPVFGDMSFRAPKMSEDCLYLNVWTPAKTDKEKLPVLVYFYGGGFMAGDGSEARYDGAIMARKGIVALTVNYRLGIFGFMAHPELTKESPHKASGNYGLLDQHAALKWVKENITAFGGDPDRIIIAGESAGSIAVFAQMASPLSKNLIAGAIGESGAMINPTLAPVSLAEGEKKGTDFAAKVSASGIADLRKIPAAQLLDDSYKHGMGSVPATVDGYFLPELPVALFAKGKQAKVPLLVGWNSAEVPYQALLRTDAPTPENYLKTVKALYGEKATEVIALYPGSNNDEVIQSATDLASDRFIVYSTWKWADLHQNTGKKPVYRYLFSKSKPPMSAQMNNATPGLAGGFTKGTPAKAQQPPVSTGAPHAFEIEYAMGNLATNKAYEWTADDFKVSETMLNYFANFIKNGNPNGKGLPAWEAIKSNEAVNYINIDTNTRTEREIHRKRYLFLDQQYQK